MSGQPSIPVRVGIIGCGTIAYWAHLRTLRRLRGAALAAAADPDPAARTRTARLFHGPIRETSADVLQGSDIDAVIIATPPPLHAELTIAAAAAGKHVYVEKPLATAADEARAAVDAVARADIVATVGFNFRHHPAYARARALLKAGCIGRIRNVQTAFCEPVAPAEMPGWKRQRASGGGALLDLASHHVDLLRWFLDQEVALVQARITSDRTEHDSAALALTMQSGVEVQMFVSFCAGPADFFEFIGEDGTLGVDRHALAPRLRRPRRAGYGAREVWTPPSASAAALWMRRLAQPSYQPSFRRSLDAFIRRVRGLPVPLATLEDGERSLAVILAAEESARQNARVSVP
ncbi:MAG: Gfo/Idh/MocA family oxidoreductase [Acidobacteria bacterium]|nr:Gfo/Idh/MocA family oxidoreductase [Acidobacteriota bacterium]